MLAVVNSSKIIYSNIQEKARGIKDWNYGREIGDYCDGLPGSTDC